jgi:hypothetical protein
MSAKCRAYSYSKLGKKAPNSRESFYAGWEAAKAYYSIESAEDKVTQETQFLMTPVYPYFTSTMN